MGVGASDAGAVAPVLVCASGITSDSGAAPIAVLAGMASCLLGLGGGGRDGLRGIRSVSPRAFRELCFSQGILV